MGHGAECVRILVLQPADRPLALRDLLEPRGFEVHEASIADGPAALRCAPHAAVLDLDVDAPAAVTLCTAWATDVGRRLPLLGLSTRPLDPAGLSGAGVHGLQLPCAPIVLVSALCRLIAASAMADGPGNRRLVRALGFRRGHPIVRARGRPGA
ncbi:MAG: hypothetical protein IPH07_08290 [Deltaproteobacteria bacterium]|jgi:hypothetical protein|nr:hypothetical protein [Deltaproteobacteria bacterium]MBK8236738.1 hypothetical protein [Deltaproteobacteria bacterium]MBK8720032.1 hypothetical protein [Deltaproteobacteria bacterium]MBP7292278.1 hypothetical protein [Nannocystaceae bacterium]